jgi:hypothetical protein
MKIKLTLDTEKIAKHFSEGQIAGFMRELEMSYTEALFYLWLYNFVGICRKELETDNGRPMYRKFARCINSLFIKCGDLKTEKTEKAEKE